MRDVIAVFLISLRKCAEIKDILVLFSYTFLYIYVYKSAMLSN